jgi:hypothetical protein
VTSPSRVAKRIGAIVVVLGVAWLVFRSTWSTDLVISSYGLRYGYDRVGGGIRKGEKPSSVTFCASGHFDLGFLGELQLRFLQVGPDDNEASDCVTVTFVNGVARGEYRLLGDGFVGGGAFRPRSGHATEVRTVQLTRGCFCVDSTTPAVFDGELIIDQLEPPRGRLTLGVVPEKGSSTHIDMSLRRFEWSAERGY